MAAKGGGSHLICPTTGWGGFVRGGGCAFSYSLACGRAVGQLYSRWPGCPTCWLACFLELVLVFLSLIFYRLVGVCGCEVVWGCLSSALRASVGSCRWPLALYLISLIFQQNLSCVFCSLWFVCCLVHVVLAAVFVVVLVLASF